MSRSRYQTAPTRPGGLCQIGAAVNPLGRDLSDGSIDPRPAIAFDLGDHGAAIGGMAAGLHGFVIGHWAIMAGNY